MRVAPAIGLLLCVGDLLQPVPAAAACAPHPAKLGVSRTIVIDAATGPKFGIDYYNDDSLLADGEVVLTFDDGPLRAYVEPILATLAKHCTKATFFMVGTAALPDPQIVREVARQGHTVASHTWSHPNLQKLTPLEAETEIEMGISAVRRALGKPIAPFFRFPYLRDTEATLEHLRNRKFAAFGMDVDTRDFEAKDVPAILERVLGSLEAKRKGIILMHDIHAFTALALPLLLKELKTRGFKVVHLEAKVPAQTVARYDAMVEKEAERIRLASLHKDVGRQSLTWPRFVAPAHSRGRGPIKGPAAVSRPTPRKR
jgi:peptidoglycan-N-acetylglucosamine deacetylase